MVALAAVAVWAVCAMTAIASMDACVVARRTAPAVGGAPLRLSETGLYDSSGAIDRAQSSVRPAVPALVGRRGEVAVDPPAGRRQDRRLRRRRVAAFRSGTEVLEAVRVGRPQGRDADDLEGRRGRMGLRDVSVDGGSDGRIAGARSGSRQRCRDRAGQAPFDPGIEDCNACHGPPRAVVLGFNALQLSDDRDPLAPHAEPLSPDAVTMRSLVETDRLYPPRPELAADPPRIRESDPDARAALGYLSANCGGCHNDRGPLARLGLVLLHDTARDGASEPRRNAHITVDAARPLAMPGVPADDSRIVAPGVTRTAAPCSIACDRGARLRRCRLSARQSRTRKRSSLSGIGSRT